MSYQSRRQQEITDDMADLLHSLRQRYKERAEDIARDMIEDGVSMSRVHEYTDGTFTYHGQGIRFVHAFYTREEWYDPYDRVSSSPPESFFQFIKYMAYEKFNELVIKAEQRLR